MIVQLSPNIYHPSQKVAWSVPILHVLYIKSVVPYIQASQYRVELVSQ